MPSTALLDAPAVESRCTISLEDEILDHLNEQDVLSLDSLIALLPQYSWNQIFHTIDRLARSRRIVLRRHRFDYTLFSNQYAS
jgi:hypothetical protein